MITVAVIGAGHWGPNLIRNFANPPVSDVRWVVDRSEARLDQVKGRFPDVATATEASEAFEDDEVDAVVVATPTTTHYGLVRAALEAGRHVLVEKPITTSAREADELCVLAESKDLVLMVGHVFVYNVGVERVKAYIDDEMLGRIYYVSMVRTNLGPIRMDVSAAWDLASHDISIANYWFGAQPESVSATGGNWINAGIHDAVFATLRYPDNIIVNLHASWLHPRKAREITIIGERRMLTLDDMNLLEPVRIYDKGVTDERTRPSFVDTFAQFRSSIRDGDITIPHVPLGEPLKAECDHFLACVRDGARPKTSGADGAAVVRVLEALERSLQQDGVTEEVQDA